MKTALAAATFLLLSCSQAGTPAHKTSDASPTTPATSPGDLPSSVDFSCRLPVVIGNTTTDGFEYEGGFIDFPSGSHTADPSGVVRRPAGQDFFATAAAPTLHGFPTGTPFYDRAVRRWVPAGSSESSPDGLHYAYAYVGPDRQNAQIHVVDARSGTETLYATSLPDWERVADYDSGNIYLTGSGLGGPGIDVQTFNLATGTSRRLVAGPGVLAVRNGYAWIGRFDPRDTTPPTYTEIVPINTIVRITLATGDETVWYYHPGQYLDVRGFDAQGNPVISIPSDGQSFDATELRLVQQPGGQGLVVSGGGLALSPAQGDRDRLWFGGPNGVYVFTPQRGLVKVFNFHGDAGLQIFPAGFCV